MNYLNCPTDPPPSKRKIIPVRVLGLGSNNDAFVAVDTSEGIEAPFKVYFSYQPGEPATLEHPGAQEDVEIVSVYRWSIGGYWTSVADHELYSFANRTNAEEAILEAVKDEIGYVQDYFDELNEQGRL
jgi:hypothetical protein